MLAAEQGEWGPTTLPPSSADEEGFSDRPGSSLVPRLRRLRDSLRRAGRLPGTGDSARKVRGHLRHRLLQPLSVLHEHVRLPHHSRPRAGRGDGRESHASGSRSLGGDRRRRFALHRRQSHHSHAAPQRRHQGADVQQQDLRPDQGPIFADVGIREEDASPLRSAPPIGRSIRWRWRSARKPPSSRARWTSSRGT